MLRFDQERALAALPRLLPSEEERREAVEIVRADRLRRRRDHARERGRAREDRADSGPRRGRQGAGGEAGRAGAPELGSRGEMKKEQDPSEIAHREAGARVPGLSGADRALRRARAGDHGGRASLRRVLADRRGRGGRGGADPADPGRAGGQDPGGRGAARSRHRALPAGRCAAQPRRRRQGGRDRARGRGRDPDEGQPAHRRADGRGGAEGDRAADRAPDQPRVHHGRADLSQAARGDRRRDQHLPRPRDQGRHRPERDRHGACARASSGPRSRSCRRSRR